MDTVIRGAQTLLADGLVTTDVLLRDDTIQAIAPDHTPEGAREIDAAGRWLLPGIVDIHGDAFERQIMPRPGVHFPLDIALHDTDQQLISNGITTAYHGITYSWEPGLRGRDNVLSLIDALITLAPLLDCDTRLHLRFETHNLNAVDEIASWLATGKVGLLAFNDHTPMVVAARQDPNKTAKVRSWAERSNLSLADYNALVDDIVSRGSEVPTAETHLAAAAAEHGIPLLSHDDDSPERRQYYQALGCHIAEFPLDEATAHYARSLDNAVVFGAPNVLRGGSHNNAVCATSMVKQGLCTVLASDYYYPAPLQAAFRLVRDGHCDWQSAWNLVSYNPAQAAGLHDRGSIAPGKRADLILVDSINHLPRVAGVWVAGRQVFGRE